MWLSVFPRQNNNNNKKEDTFKTAKSQEIMCGLYSFIMISKSDHNLSQLCALLKLLTSRSEQTVQLFNKQTNDIYITLYIFAYSFCHKYIMKPCCSFKTKQRQQMAVFDTFAIENLEHL